MLYFHKSWKLGNPNARKLSTLNSSSLFVEKWAAGHIQENKKKKKGRRFQVSILLPKKEMIN